MRRTMQRHLQRSRPQRLSASPLLGAARKTIAGAAKRTAEATAKRIGKAGLQALRARGRKPRIPKYHKLMHENPEAREFFSRLGKIFPDVFGTKYFRRLHPEQAREIAVMLWESGFSEKEARNLFEKLRAERVLPEELHKKIEEIAEQRAQELQETGAVETVFT